MKNYLKVSSAIFVAILIIPQVAFAAWWNPFSWGIFSFLFNDEESVEVVEIPTNIEVPSENLQETTPDNEDTEEAPETEVSENIEVSNETSGPAPQAQTPVFVTPEPTPKAEPPVTATPEPYTPIIEPAGTLCNGSYWNDCPEGEDFVCPATGDAYCQAPQSSEPEIDNDQFCKDTYGERSIWDAYTSNCACKSGYLVNADGTSCISTYLFCKNLYGSHVVWDESSFSCVCESQYQVSADGSSCVLQPAYSSACQKAISNRTTFQDQHTKAIASACPLSGRPSECKLNISVLESQYYTQLPSFEAEVQASCY